MLVHALVRGAGTQPSESIAALAVLGGGSLINAAMALVTTRW
jgi:hypothetical protein